MAAAMLLLLVLRLRSARSRGPRPRLPWRRPWSHWLWVLSLIVGLLIRGFVIRDWHSGSFGWASPKLQTMKNEVVLSTSHQPDVANVQQDLRSTARRHHLI